MHHQRMWASSLAVIPQTLSLPPALGLKRERTEGRKREKFYIYLDVTHTHIYIHIYIICEWFQGCRHLPSMAGSPTTSAYPAFAGRQRARCLKWFWASRVPPNFDDDWDVLMIFDVDDLCFLMIFLKIMYPFCRFSSFPMVTHFGGFFRWESQLMGQDGLHGDSSLHVMRVPNAMIFETK